MTKDRVTGLVSAILGIMIAVLTSKLPKTMMAGDIGPAVFPYISAGILIICGIALFITGKKKDEKPYFTKDQFKRLEMIFGIMVLYVIAENFIGFFIPTVIVSLILCVLFGKGKNISLWKSGVFAVLLTTALYFVFTKTFSMVLPRGILF